MVVTGDADGLDLGLAMAEQRLDVEVVAAVVCERWRVRGFCSRDNGRRRPVVRCCGGGGGHERVRERRMWRRKLCWWHGGMVEHFHGSRGGCGRRWKSRRFVAEVSIGGSSGGDEGIGGGGTLYDRDGGRALYFPGSVTEALTDAYYIRFLYYRMDRCLWIRWKAGSSQVTPNESSIYADSPQICDIINFLAAIDSVQLPPSCQDYGEELPPQLRIFNVAGGCLEKVSVCLDNNVSDGELGRVRHCIALLLLYLAGHLGNGLAHLEDSDAIAHFASYPTEIPGLLSTLCPSEEAALPLFHMFRDDPVISKMLRRVAGWGYHKGKRGMQQNLYRILEAALPDDWEEVCAVLPDDLTPPGPEPFSKPSTCSIDPSVTSSCNQDP
nr:hypothetical protein Iba_chr01aCG7520 [Ipomoea batatas]